MNHKKMAKAKRKFMWGLSELLHSTPKGVRWELLQGWLEEGYNNYRDRNRRNITIIVKGSDETDKEKVMRYHAIMKAAVKENLDVVKLISDYQKEPVI